MPISALPQSTVRLLGSSVVITKPCDVVKELLDNAIDAGASFVEIAVSPNFLDTIRVRDDGHGIGVEDFDALGQRAHTSKLRAFEELGSRARETLGFRGEALAAMNALALITITTRTAKDVVATRLQLNPAAGGVHNKQPVSAPVGTTVQITKLFETLPARKQYSSKKGTKYIQSTTDLLKAYALARPDLRMSFKLLGEATHRWSYAPVCAAGVKEAALQLFGTTLANSCIHVSRNSECDQTTSPQLSQQLPEDFILEALIPKPEFDVRSVKEKGLYLSVDSRPISSKDGIAKKITAIYRPYLNRAAGTAEPCASVPNPFLQLNIQCLPYSYDVNVTPLKDEVVFGNEDMITACFEGLCRRIYPQISANDPISVQRPVRHEKDVGTEGRTGGGNINPYWGISHTSDAQTLGSSSNVQTLRTTEQLIAPRGTANRDHPVNQESMPSQESCTQSAASVARMRTSKIVNMSRANSNSTDEDSTADSVSILVPLSIMTATPAPSSRRTVGSLRIPKMSASENIERYLLSHKSETFQIATDETATKRTQPSSAASTPPPDLLGRTALQPLTESMLNAMNGQAEPESDTLSGGSDISEPNNGAERIATAYQREHLLQHTSPDPITSSLELQPMEHSSPYRSRSAVEWPTPPSSGNLRSARPLNSPFRPPLMTPQRGSPTGNTTQARSRLRVPESGRVIPFTLPGQNHMQRTETFGRTVQRVGLLATPTSTSDTGETRLQLHTQRVHGLSHQRDNMIHGPGLASQPDTRDDVSQTNLSLHRPSQYSHIMQTPLMRSLPTSVTLVSNTAQGDFTSDIVSTARTSKAISSVALVRDEPRDMTPLSNTNDSSEDPRLYLIKRRRSQAIHGVARRLSSRRLPLEVIPHHLTMQNASTSVRPNLRKVRSLAGRARLLGYDIRPGSWGHAIKFKSREEVTKVERRLHHAVEEWKQTQSQTVAVEYML
ncbi:hypothetical protein V8C42DRAFT_80733 [Trichoderma barbatum]